MTDHSKIPLPSSGRTAGKSLFERAAEQLDIKGFKPAPVPEDLDPPLLRRRISKPAMERGEPSDIPESEPIESIQLPDSMVRPEPDAVESVEPVRFSGACHTIDRDLLREHGLIEPNGSVTALLEEFRIVKRQLLQAARSSAKTAAASNAQRILVCSPHPGEGKTFCAINLAIAMAAEKDGEVLLVDADFANPSILSALGLPGGPGLMDALADSSIRVEDCVLGTDIPGLWILPAGDQTNADSEYLASNRTRELLDRLTRGAPNRMILFDSPPALAASPAAELAKYAGQAVLIARADKTGRSALEDAVSLLSDCPDIKLLLNAAHFSPSGRRFGAYYGYGE